MTANFTFADAVSGSPSYAASDMRLARAGAYVMTGVLTPRSGALSVDSFAASLSGTTVTVGPGCAIVHGAVSASTEGVYECFMTTSFTQVLAAANTQDRIDLIYVRVWNNEVDSSGATQFSPVYLTGTPSGSPVAPSIPSGQAGFKICTISVPHSGSPALTQNGVMPYTVCQGGILPAFSTGVTFSPELGQVRWRADRDPSVMPGPLEIWNGTAWLPLVPDSFPRGALAASVSTTVTGAGVTTETVDSNLGYVQATLISGRKYRVGVDGYIGNGNSADVYAVRIRDSGSASNPTSSSALIAETPFHPSANGTPGRLVLRCEDEFLCASSGVHTFGVFGARVAGSTSQFTPVSAAADSGSRPRTLWLKDVGNV